MPPRDPSLYRNRPDPPPENPDPASAPLPKWVYYAAGAALIPAIVMGVRVYLKGSRTMADEDVHEGYHPLSTAPKYKDQTRPIRHLGEDAPEPAAEATQVMREATFIDDETMGRALYAGHVKQFGTPPSQERLLTAWAQVSLETRGGREAYGYNLGNIITSSDWKGKYSVLKVKERVKRDPDEWKEVAMKFRVYDNAEQGAADYWRLINQSFSITLPMYDRGDAQQTALKLCQMGYCTALCGPYANGVGQLYRSIRGGTFEQIRDLYPGPKGGLNRPAFEPKWRNGKRSGFKIRRPHGLVGSSPTFGTKQEDHPPGWSFCFVRRRAFGAGSYG